MAGPQVNRPQQNGRVSARWSEVGVWWDGLSCTIKLHDSEGDFKYCTVLYFRYTTIEGSGAILSVVGIHHLSPNGLSCLWLLRVSFCVSSLLALGWLALAAPLRVAAGQVRRSHERNLESQAGDGTLCLMYMTEGCVSWMLGGMRTGNFALVVRDDS